jgi:hypothetical protein
MHWLLWLVPGCGAPKPPLSDDPVPTGTDPGTSTSPSSSTGSPTAETGGTTFPTGDTADTGTPPDPCAPSGGTGTFAGPTSILTTAVTCSISGDQVEYSACTEGPSPGGWVFAQETGNPGPNWSDAHRLDRVASDPQGWWNSLARRLQTQASIATWTTDVNTLFTCGSHLEDPLVMTFAVMVYDEAGAFADCVVWGQNPAALIDGTILRVNEPPFDPTPCRILP